MFLTIYNTILYQPLFNLLVYFYNIVPGHDMGLAIILLSIFIKLVLWPLFAQSIRAQRAMQAIQPKLDGLKEKYKNNKEKLGPAIMELYKTEKINPLSSCFPLLIQMPFLIAVYEVFRKGLSGRSMDLIYSFIYNPGALNHIALGFINLNNPNYFLAILAGAAQFWQSKQMMKRSLVAVKANQDKKNPLSAMNKQMLYIFPVITVVIGSSLPGGLTFYWLIFTLLGILQQTIVFNKMNKASVAAAE